MTDEMKERMEAYIHTPEPKIPMCANCKHYYPHYDLHGWPFGCGHCAYPRLKLRKAYDLCEHFEQKKVFPGLSYQPRERRTEMP